MDYLLYTRNSQNTKRCTLPENGFLIQCVVNVPKTENKEQLKQLKTAFYVQN